MNFKITNQTEFDNRKLLDKEIKKAWVEALRSGKYEQGKHSLKKDNCYCCLGVLCEINHKLDEYGYIIGGGKEYLNDELEKEFNMVYNGYFKGFSIDEKSCLTELNDFTGFTFEQIAEVIELYF
jgi:hypothetical protein